MKAILVNVFGGIVNCGTIANGLINASKKLNLQVPLIVRLEGKFYIKKLFIYINYLILLVNKDKSNGGQW